MAKNKIEWYVGLKMELAPVATFTVHPTREEARKTYRALRNAPLKAEVWMERHETVFEDILGTSVRVINTKRVR